MEDNVKRLFGNRFQVILISFLVVTVLIAGIFSLGHKSNAGKEVSVPQSRMTTDELSRALGNAKDEVEKWELCFRAHMEYEWRIRNWRKIISKAIEGKKLLESDFEKIDFSLPGDSGFGDDVENEFFNPEGTFRATPIPQDLIDSLSSKKNTRLIFNLRKSYFRPEEGDFPPHFITALTVIIPDFISVCSSKSGGWDKKRFLVENVFVAPDNREVVEEKDGNGMIEVRITPNGSKTYNMQFIALRRSKN